MKRFVAPLLLLTFMSLTARADQLVISFEKEEGFPEAGGQFTDQALPQGVVSKWANDSSVPNFWFTDDGPKGIGFPDAPAPISGEQLAGFGQGGNGVNTTTVHFDTEATSHYSLMGFHWAYRGNGNSRPGGDAHLEVECFDLFGRSLGKETFQGGLNSDWTPKFEQVKVKLPQGRALSKVIFRGVPPEPDKGHGTFFLDDLTLSKLPPVAMLALVKDGGSVCTIVTPHEAPQWTKQATVWLQQYLQQASGAAVEIHTEDDAPSGTLISVGHTRLAEHAGIDTGELKWDGCRLVVKGRVLYLLGPDNAGTQTHDWVGARGTCRAVLKFLEDYTRARWFIPSPMGEIVPPSTDIVVPATLDQTFQPAFAYSDGRSVYDVDVLNEPGKSIAAQANNFRKAVKVSPGGHTYYHAVPADKYFDDHPEYFALLDGKRTGNGNHLCTSNPQVERLLIEYMNMRFEQGLDWVSIGQEDGYLRCQCTNCDKLDRFRDAPAGMRWETFQNAQLKDLPPERLFTLHKAVIDQMAQSQPQKKVMLMCYAPTAWPSKKIPHFGDNVIGELMNLNPDYVDAWRDKVAGLAGFTYWFNTTTPMGLNVHMTPTEAAERIRYLHENGFIAVSLDPEGTWGLEGPVYYMLGRLLGDPTLDEENLIEEYCRGVYGRAAPDMLAFFDLLHRRLSQVVPLDKHDIAADARNTRLPRWLTTSQMYLSMYPPDVLEKLEAFMQRAELHAHTQRAKGWVRLSRDQFDFIKLLTETLISHRAWQVKPTRENWLELKQSVADFDAYRLKIVSYPNEHTEIWFPGHGTFCKWLTANFDDTSIAFYTPWETRKAAVLKRGISGTAMGYGRSYYYSFIDEPLTLDFSKEP